MTGRRDRIAGSLLAGAVGDALGAPVEFDSLRAIHERFGLEGVRDLVAVAWPLGSITDDTQMTLFTAEGILDAFAAAERPAAADVVAAIRRAYLRWYRTQTHDYSERNARPEGALQLIARPQMWAQRAPGTTCIAELADGGRGATAAQRNDRKGCGGVMRVAPVGYVERALGGPRAVFEVAAEAAAITHGHPTGLVGNISAQIRLVSEAVAPEMAYRLAIAIRRSLQL